MKRYSRRISVFLILCLVLQFVYSAMPFSMGIQYVNAADSQLTGNTVESNSYTQSSIQQGDGTGLKSEYFGNPDLTNLKVTKIDSTVNFDWGSVLPDPSIDNDSFSVRWSGQVQPLYSETFVFFTQTHGGVKLWVDNQLVIDDWGANSMNSQSGMIWLSAGKNYDIKMEYCSGHGSALANLSWSSTSQTKQIIPQSQLYPIGTPQNITATTTDTSITLGWDTVTGTTDYDVEVDGSIVSSVLDNSFTINDLVPGTQHTYRVRAKSGSITGSWSLPVIKSTLLGIPSGIETILGDTFITLVWGTVSGATGYDIEADGVVLNSDINTTYTLTNLLPGSQHVYKVRAKSSAVTGEWSTPVTMSALLPSPNNIVAVPSSSSMELTWDTVAGAISYDIEADGEIIGNLAMNSYIHSNLSPGTQHTYRVRAANSGETGSWSLPVAKATLLNAPSNFQGSAEDTKITLMWGEVPDADGYDIEVDGTVIDNGTNTTYIHNDLTPGSQHRYRVRAKNSDGPGNWTDLMIRMAVSGLQININAVSNTSITLNWNAVIGSSGYDVEVDGVVIDCGTNTSYIHSGLEPNTQHTYRARTKNSDVDGIWSAPVTQLTLLSTPANIGAAATNTSVLISWDAVNNSTSYEIEIDKKIVDVGKNTSYLHEGLAANTQHTYRVRAKNSNNISNWSGLITRTTLPDYQITLKATAADTYITLNWNTVAGATGYDIEVDGVVVDNGLSTNYVNSGLIPNTQHVYRARAKNTGGVSDWSEPLAVTTGINIPGNIIASATDISVNISWGQVTGATGYDIEVDGKVIDNGQNTAYIHTGVIIGEQHSYRVRARYSIGTSSWSEYIIKAAEPAFGNGTGLRGDYFDNEDFTGLKFTQLDKMILFDWGSDSPDSSMEQDTFSERWTGQILPKYSEDYTFYTEVHGSIKLWVNNQLVINGPEINGTNKLSGTISLVAGKRYDIKVEYSHWHGVALVKLFWSSKSQLKEVVPQGQLYPVAVPAGLDTVATMDTVNVSWASAGYTTGYNIEVDGMVLDNGVNTSYIHNGLLSGTQHTYRVRAKNGPFTGEWSLPVTETTLFGEILNLKATATQTAVSLTWDPIPGETVYDVEVDGAVVNNGVSVTYKHNNLVPGTNHKYRVRVRNSVETGQWSDYISISTSLGVPVGVTATATEDIITVKWEAIAGAVSYDIEIDGEVINNGLSTSYAHTNLGAGTQHSYRVRAVGKDVTGDWSVRIQKPTLPGIPENIAAASTSKSITVTWNSVQGASGYDIEIYGAAVDIGLSTTYTHTGLAPNMQISYRVRAKNASGTGMWSNYIAKTTLPGEPKNLKAVAKDTSILVSWDEVAGATGYDIEIDGTTVTELTAATYLHSGFQTNTLHSYRVRSKNNDGVSEWSQPVTVTTLPSAPTNLNTTITSSTITLTWDGVNGATGYDLEIDGVVLDIGNNTNFVHKELDSGSKHTYRVRSRIGSIESIWSNEISTMTLPSIPTNLSVVGTGTKITLLWDAVTGASGYDVEEDGQIIDNGPRTVYEHDGLSLNTGYTYRVRAKNAAGAGEWSSAITKSTLLGVPENLSANAASTTITITWNSVSGATGYDILADGVVIDNGAGTAHIHAGLMPNSKHYYRVRAKNADKTSEWSAAIVKTTVVGVPANIKTVGKSKQITVSWDYVEGATGYDIEIDGVSIDNGTSTSYVQDSLKPNTIHKYRVRAKNDNGRGDWSEVISQITAPAIPANLKAEATINDITVTWDAADGTVTYDIEVDGEVISDLRTAIYKHTGLTPNTRHSYRVRAKNDGGTSDWSEILEKNTTPEITINVEKDNMFNFVVVAPKKKDTSSRKIIVNYNPDSLEVVDLCAITPKVELVTGTISGTNIRVEEFTPGRIVFVIDNANKTVVNSIRFISKMTGGTKVTYVVE